MKKIILATLLTVSTMTSAYAAHPQCGKTELSEIMEDMKDTLKDYKGALKAKDEAGLRNSADKLLKLAMKSKEHVPLTISDKKSLSSSEQAKFTKYQKGMEKMIDSIKSLAAADNDKSRITALKAVSAGSNKGHKAFKMDCKS